MTDLRDAAESATAGVPVAKPLVWHGPDIRDEFSARSPFGTYVICEQTKKGRWAMGAYHETVEAAKSAVQEDYDIQVLAIINPDFLSELDTARAEIDRLRGDGWLEGVPQSPWSKEWFIAETIYGDRVVLKALPEEFTYDFKTADDTYIMARNIKRWMPFPDSEYVSPSMSSALTAAQARIAELELALKPFAKWPGYRPNSPDSTKVWTVTIHSKEQDGLTMGDFGHARATLSPVKENDRG